MQLPLRSAAPDEPEPDPDSQTGAAPLSQLSRGQRSATSLAPPPAEPKVPGIPAQLRTPTAFFASRTCGRDRLEALSTAETGRAAEGKGLHQLYNRQSPACSPGHFPQDCQRLLKPGTSSGSGRAELTNTAREQPQAIPTISLFSKYSAASRVQVNRNYLITI